MSVRSDGLGQAHSMTSVFDLSNTDRAAALIGSGYTSIPGPFGTTEQSFAAAAVVIEEPIGTCTLNRSR
jgi:hypothetical protein